MYLKIITKDILKKSFLTVVWKILAVFIYNKNNTYNKNKYFNITA